MQNGKAKISHKSGKKIDDNFECYFAQAKISVDLAANISKKLSKLIFERIENFRVDCIIDWDLFMAEIEVKPEDLLNTKKKIQNHYYYKIASAKKKKKLRERSIRAVKTRSIFHNWCKNSSGLFNLR